MKYGLVLPNMGSYSDARTLAELARLGEESGWDGFFLSDTIHYGHAAIPTSDPWIDLAAVAVSTERIKLGLLVSAPPRRRPWKMAREAVTLDHLSNGRLILGVGSGDEHDLAFEAFGEEMDLKKRARMLDESLDILQGLWSGKPFSYQGEHYQVDEITFLPPPVQASGIPLWIGWLWPYKKPLARAARYEGANPFAVNPDGSYAQLTPADIQELKQLIDERRSQDKAFDIAIHAQVFAAANDEQKRSKLQAYAEAGVTWALGGFFSVFDAEEVRKTIRQGPPSL
ncbi:LLM class flavin-dependent oxidoreductase [Ktedonosporobacter rubrisoli]|uniref:LLM class flavin-dependent oxidoreductase n=1 Tax=Ktedonosporobacter rubrisoli TaxID=2509675 RepID=A0A4P6JKQ0_KTERU|nr:LLM class flavin-dependent oxidoreductase [Ktedonosporobacter rubrisoli]QBD75735.1 LLM class flavin-dependent oxidoreductase [Ktedonosporobacter rubrisoli]